MVELNSTFRLVRTVVFISTTLFAVIAIALGGLVTSQFLGGLLSFAALAIATGVLTVLSLPAMLILSRMRKGVFTSMIAFEIGWIWFLWIMWISAGGSTATVDFIVRCNFYADFETTCSETSTSALAAFSFLSWIFLMFYDITLITLTFRQHLRGNTGVWTSEVTETDFNAEGVYNSQVAYDPKVSPVYPIQYPPGGTPGFQQPTPGSYTGSYMQPVASSYPQSPDAASAFTHSSPQAQPGHSPHPQV